MSEIENIQEQYNIWFAKMSEKHLPDINMRAQYKDSKDGKVIIASIRNPNNSSKEIEIATYESEITLYFGNYHCHFDSWSDSDHEEEFIEFAKFLHRLLNDEVLIIECYENEEYTMGSTIESIDEISDYDAMKIIIRSWSGNKDSEILKSH